LKILFVTTISPTIGFLIPHIELLVQKGHKVDVAFNVVRDVRPELSELGCNVHHIEFQRSPLSAKNFLAYRKIKQLVLKEKYELIHTHTPVASFLTRLACRNIKGLKILYTAHGFHFYKGAPLKNWIKYYTIEKLAGLWTDGIITMNEEDYNIAQKMNMRRKGSVFYVHGVGVDLSRFSPVYSTRKIKLRQEYEYATDDFILFYAAELNYNKHQDMLISAVKVLKTRIPNLKLLLAGRGNYREQYEKQVAELGLENNVKFLGFRKDISNLLKISDVAVACSRREGLPVNVMEAMATGLPVVVTDCRGQRDLVINGVNGFVVNPDDVEGFANHVEKLYRNKDLMYKFGEMNLTLVKNYSLENVLNEMREIYACYLNETALN